MNQHSKPRGIRKTFLSSTAIFAGVAAMMAPGMAVAQDAVAEVEEEEVIVVTGTRIARPDFEFANPIASADAETIVRSGVTNLTNFLTDMPALLNSFDSEESADTSGSGTQGLNLLDLRGLGTQRTLVLVDGRRHVSGDQFSGAVDINSIPVDLIQRVDVMTGGASAIYGADGVTGVVNFIMRDDFEGLTTRVQYGEAAEGGGQNSFLSVVGGRNFAEGRGNFTLGFETSLQDGVDRDQRDYTRLGRGESLLEVPGGGGAFTRDFFRDVRYIDTSPGGSVTVDFDGIYLGPDDTTGSVGGNGSLSGMDYLGDGSLWDEGEQSGSGFMVGGSGSLLDEFNDQLLPGLDRYTLNARAHYDIGVHRVFGEAKWSRTETFFVAQPTYDFGLFMPIDNAFMPANIQADALQPGNLGDVFGGVLMFRDNIDLGNTTQDVSRDTYRTVLGLSGPVTSNINYEVSMVWGRNETEIVYRARNNERWLAAVDVVDNGSGPECRSNDGVSTPADWTAPTFFNTFNPGECVPANIWGVGNLSQEAIDWIMTDLTHTITNSQYVLNAFISGDTSDWFSLPAGPVGFALGAEYREEESEYDHDNVAESLPGETFWNGEGVDSRGRYDVAEVFGEIEVPILRDMALARDLTFDAAYRFSEYSSVGSTNTWKYGLRYRPTEWLMLRGTQARAVRAPNITELYQPATVTSELINDPCDQSAVNAGSAFRYANCLATFTALGLADPDPNNFVDTTSSSIDGLFVGNPDLDAETADTTTYGFVLEPSFLPGLSFSADYWEIELVDAIQFFDSQDIVDYCYDLPQPNQYCALVQRTPVPVVSTSSPAGGLIFFQRQAVNVAQFVTSGVDFAVRYRLDPANWGLDNVGRFNVAFNATNLRDYTFIDALGTQDEQVDDPYLPEWQTVFDLTWMLGDLTLNYGWTWFSETERFNEDEIANDPLISDPAYFNYSERSTHDLFASYDISDRVQIYGGVNNFANQEPDRGVEAYPVSQLGRFFYLGARATFN
jgi:outer membrane receptor protein involved in Fe transport